MSATSFLPLGSFSSSADKTRESWRGPPLLAGYSVTHTFIKRNVFLCHTIMSVKLLKSSYWTCLSKKGLPCLLVSCLRFPSLTGKLDEVLLFCLSFALQAFPSLATLEQKTSETSFLGNPWIFSYLRKVPSISCCSSCPFWLSLTFLFPALHSSLPLWVPADKEVVEGVVPADRN